MRSNEGEKPVSGAAGIPRIPRGTPKTPERHAFESLIHGAAKFELRGEGLTLYVVECTPEKAQAVLDHCNAGNRRIRQKKIGEYSGYMKRGDWMMRGTLEFLYPSGRLHDGQHRLLAIVHAKTTAKFLVQLLPDAKADKASQFTDIGVSRNLGDYLHFHGVYEAYRTAPLLIYEKNARISAGNPFQTAQYERAEYLSVYEEIGRDKVRQAFEIVPAPIWRKLGVARAVVDWFALQVVDVDADAAHLFLQYVASPENLKRTDPMFCLHERLVELISGPPGRHRKASVSAIEQATLLVKAWNLHYDQQPATPTKLRYRIKEEFPPIKGRPKRKAPAAPAESE